MEDKIVTNTIKCKSGVRFCHTKDIIKVYDTVIKYHCKKWSYKPSYQSLYQLHISIFAKDLLTDLLVLYDHVWFYWSFYWI